MGPIIKLHTPKGYRTLSNVGCTKWKRSEPDGQPRELGGLEEAVHEVAAMDEFEDPTATATVRGRGRFLGAGRVSGVDNK